MKLAVLVGTRPEAIKLAPVIQALRNSGRHELVLCATGQHRELLDQALSAFSLKADVGLDVMTEGQTLPDLTATLLVRLHAFYAEHKPDWVIVQGDTATVMTAALCAYYHRIKVAHVEAGLRSFNKYSPFPEEINRKVTGVLADLHFAPTETARSNLLAEGISPEHVLVIGNTIVDAVDWMLARLDARASLPPRVGELLDAGRRIILVTCHRRENFGAPLLDIAAALRRIARKYPGAALIFPVHPNPEIRKVMNRELDGVDNIILLPPLAYEELLSVMRFASLILTDSGGIQEEAPSLRVPVLVLRDTTERPEGVAAGFAKLVGADADRIVHEASAVLDDVEASRERLLGKDNPYGDGKAGLRIAQVFNDM